MCAYLHIQTNMSVIAGVVFRRSTFLYRKSILFAYGIMAEEFKVKPTKSNSYSNHHNELLFYVKGIIKNKCCYFHTDKLINFTIFIDLVSVSLFGVKRLGWPAVTATVIYRRTTLHVRWAKCSTLNKERQRIWFFLIVLKVSIICSK